VRFAIVLILMSAPAWAEPCRDDPRYDRAQKHRGQRFAEPKEFLGKSATKLVERFGEPYCKSPAKWRYTVPDGCAYERDMVTLWFRGGKVARVNIVHEVTGEECMGFE
jgi:hypothetical protein